MVCVNRQWSQEKEIWQWNMTTMAQTHLRFRLNCPLIGRLMIMATRQTLRALTVLIIAYAVCYQALSHCLSSFVASDKAPALKSGVGHCFHRHKTPSIPHRSGLAPVDLLVLFSGGLQLQFTYSCPSCLSAMKSFPTFMGSTHTYLLV